MLTMSVASPLRPITQHQHTLAHPVTRTGGFITCNPGQPLHPHVRRIAPTGGCQTRIRPRIGLGSMSGSIACFSQVCSCSLLQARFQTQGSVSRVSHFRLTSKCRAQMSSDVHISSRL